METVFLYFLNKSIAAIWMIVTILLLRIVTRRIPKWIYGILWIMVGIRLLCPIGFQSEWSVISSVHTVPEVIMYSAEPSIDSGFESVDQWVNPKLPSGGSGDSLDGDHPMAVVIEYASYIWTTGIVLLTIYSTVRWLRLRKWVRASIKVKERVYICDDISAPFILGVFRPKVYLPSTLREEQMKIVLDHENAHLNRDDHWTKMIGFIVVILHWFNPLVWLAYQKMSEDIELACDEKVIRNVDEVDKRKYIQVLLDLSQIRSVLFNTPLAFGEVAVKRRVSSIVQYKRQSPWVVFGVIFFGFFFSLGFMTNPTDNRLAAPDHSAMTEREKKIYDTVKEKMDFSKYFLVDITGDGKNELITVYENKSHSWTSPARDVFSFWGTNEKDEVVNLCGKTVTYSGTQSRFAEDLYLYPEKDGSYTLISDFSRVFDFRTKTEIVRFVKNRFVLDQDSYRCERESFETKQLDWSDPVYVEYQDILQKSVLLVDSEIKLSVK